MSRWREIKNKTDKTLDGKNTEEVFEPISLMTRFKAFIVDSFMITMPIMYFVVYMVMGSGEAFSEDRVYGWAIILALHAFVILGFLIIKKETPGMRAYKLKLIHSSAQKQINIFQILLRYILMLITSVTIFGLLPFFRKDKKTFQDLFSNTYLSIDEETTK